MKAQAVGAFADVAGEDVGEAVEVVHRARFTPQSRPIGSIARRAFGVGAPQR